MNGFMQGGLMWLCVGAVFFLVGLAGYGINYWAVRVVRENAPMKTGSIALRKDRVEMGNIKLSGDGNCKLVAHLSNGTTQTVIEFNSGWTQSGGEKKE